MRTFTRLFFLLLVIGFALPSYGQSESSRKIKIKQIDRHGKVTVIKEAIPEGVSWKDYFEKLDRSQMERIEIEVTDAADKNRHVKVEINNPIEIEFGDREFNFDSNARRVTNRRPIIGFYENHNDGEGIGVGNIIGSAKAASAGLQSGDRIVEVDGQSARSTTQLRRILREHEIGDVVPVVVTRDGQRQTLQIELSGETTHSYATQRDPCAVFIGVQTNESHSTLSGLRITRIIEDTPAERSDLLTGDVITAMDAITVNTFQELRQERDKHQPGDSFTLSVLRDGVPMDIKAQFRTCEVEAEVEVAIPAVEVIEEVEEVAPSLPELDMPELQLRSFNAFPNPTVGNLQVQFEAAQEPTSIRLIDLSGRTVYEEQFPNFSGTYNNTLELGAVPPGTYFLQIQQQNQVRTERIIVQPRA